MISIIEQTAGAAGGDLLAQVEEIFSREGLLSKAPIFEYRPQQQQMAVAVARALEKKENLLVEAGTGVGKSLAYLIPAILFAVARKRKAIVCTHTINLQEQLTEKDLPMLSGILPVDFSFAMLKGRQNYLCTRRLFKARQQTESLFTSPEAQELQRIFEWAQETGDGSLSDFETEPDPKVWSQVCSERGLCTPKVCGHQSEFGKEHGVCFFQRARSRIISADVLVLNHTLFFTLLGSLEDDVKDGILFKRDFVVFDEAHTVENVAARHIGLSVSSGQIRYSLQRLYNPRTGKGLLTLLQQGAAVELVGEVLKQSDQFFEAVEQACEELARKKAGRNPSRGWSELRIRRPDLVEDCLTLTLQRLREKVSDLIRMTDDNETGQELLECNRRLADLREAVAAFLSQSLEEHVYWVERTGKTQRNLALNAAPVDVAAYLRRQLFQRETSVIMTSATLSTQMAPAQCGPEPPPGRLKGSGGAGGKAGQGLNYVARRVGGESATLLQVGSPFDYERQMKVFVAGKMPDPREPGYQEALRHWIEHFVVMTQGKALVLFTNSKLMRELGEEMGPFFEKLGFELFVQGSGAPRSLLLEKFKNDLNSVLFGTDSFWQGVDVPGASLSNVIITRLPFAVPDHPLIEAKVENIEARGGNSFMEYSLPEAILKFRQGVGRLIRGKNDSGVVVVLDNRVVTKRYGRMFLEAIPECPLEVV